MWNKSTDTFLCCDRELEDAAVVLYGAPFDSTTSYRPGARFGSAAIRRESYGIESYSPYQNRDLEGAPVLDAGDLELSLGDSRAALDQIRRATAEILDGGRFPFLLGGEHLVTLGAFEAVFERYPQVHVVHFDAHADLREEYLGVSLSHACVMRRCWELTGDGRIHQFGIRSGEKAEFVWSKSHTDLHPFSLDKVTDALGALGDAPVYLTVDLDVLNPAVFPGTGTPEPGGVSFDELRRAVCQVCRRDQLVGADVVELSPPWDSSGVSTITACKIVREMLLAILS